MRHLCFVLLLLSPAVAAVNTQAVADVAAGRLKEAKASWWGFEPGDATACLQAAISSGVAKLTVDNVGQPWVVTPLKLVSNQEIVFEPGVVVQAKAGAFRGTGDCLLEARDKENITLRGPGATLRMRRSDYAQPPYAKAEWRHTLSLMSCRNVKVYGLTLAESGGDGIYLGTAGDRGTNRGILIKDVACDRHYRQGISVISAQDLTIEDTVMRDTGGTAPMAGIDFEPNDATERLVNIVLRRCTFEGNRGDGIDLYIPNLRGDSTPVSIRIEGCRESGDQGCGLRLYTGNGAAEAVLGQITVADCRFERPGHSGIEVTNKPTSGLALRFERCEVVDPARAQATTSPIALGSAPTAGDPIGGIVFADCLVRDSMARNPMALTDHAGVGLTEVTGNLRWEHGGRVEKLPLTPEQLGVWMPSTKFRSVLRLSLVGLDLRPVGGVVPAEQRVAPAVQLRGHTQLALYAQQGEQVSLRLHQGQVGNYAGVTLTVKVSGPDGKEVARGEAAFGQDSTTTFTAPVSGLYHVAVATGSNRVALVAASHPVCVLGDGESVHLIGTVGVVYFWVPTGTKDFAVRVQGEGTAEAVHAALLDAAGKVVSDADNITALHQFDVTMPQPSPGEAWSLRLARPTAGILEDCYIDLRGIPPILGFAPAGLLKPVNSRPAGP